MNGWTARLGAFLALGLLAGPVASARHRDAPEGGGVAPREHSSASAAADAAGGEIVGAPWTGGMGIAETVERIMERQKTAPPSPRSFLVEADVRPRDRWFTPSEDPLAPFVSRWPPGGGGLAEALSTPQSVGRSFKAVGTAQGESPYIPPDSMGAVGPTQILVHVNGRIKVFDRAGNPGALDATDATFWASVSGGQGISDPEVRYDRLTARWFLLAINLAATNNRIVLAVSSGPTITAQTSFTFYYFTVSSGGGGTSDNNKFCDYPSFGVDAHALYAGCNMFDSSGFLAWTTGFVVRKSSVTGGGPIVVTAFRNLTGGTSAGPYAPRGVDNDDPQAVHGYFIGADIATFGRLVLRRVSNPGGTPTISGNVNLTVPQTSKPLTQPALGSAMNLDASDDRLYMAAIRKNKITGSSTLWTAQTLAVDPGCVGASTGTDRRNAARWYEIGNLATTPALVQSGTLCDPAPSNPRGFIYPTVIANGQGHMALGATTSSPNQYAGVAVSGRLRSDPPGATGAFTTAQPGLAAYTKVANGRNRWGDYSFTAVDPNDDMTVWTVQEYADSPSNQWAVRVVELRAPPPAVPSSASGSVCRGQASTSVTITGTSIAGSEFFDPGADFGGPGYANRITATVTGGVIVTDVAFIDPTRVALTLDTRSALPGPKDVTVTNPDGQGVTGAGVLRVEAPTPTASSNGPVCEGGTLRLSASLIPGASYSWIGPSGFTSFEQNPSVPSAGPQAAGTYSVVATVEGCASEPGTTVAVVQATGAACEDGNACTTGDRCVEGTCAGEPVATPPEVGNTVRLSKWGGTASLGWTEPPGPFNVYRGFFASPWSYNHACLGGPIGGTSLSDPADPPSGGCFYYLVTRVGPCGESVAGRDSAGAPVPNPSPCR